MPIMIKIGHQRCQLKRVSYWYWISKHRTTASPRPLFFFFTVLPYTQKKTLQSFPPDILHFSEKCRFKYGIVLLSLLSFSMTYIAEKTILMNWKTKKTNNLSQYNNLLLDHISMERMSPSSKNQLVPPILMGSGLTLRCRVQGTLDVKFSYMQ